MSEQDRWHHPLTTNQEVQVHIDQLNEVSNRRDALINGERPDQGAYNRACHEYVLASNWFFERGIKLWRADKEWRLPTREEGDLMGWEV